MPIHCVKISFLHSKVYCFFFAINSEKEKGKQHQKKQAAIACKSFMLTLNTSYRLWAALACAMILVWTASASSSCDRHFSTGSVMHGLQQLSDNTGRGCPLVGGPRVCHEWLLEGNCMYNARRVQSTARNSCNARARKRPPRPVESRVRPRARCTTRFGIASFPGPSMITKKNKNPGLG